MLVDHRLVLLKVKGIFIRPVLLSNSGPKFSKRSELRLKSRSISRGGNSHISKVSKYFGREAGELLDK